MKSLIYVFLLLISASSFAQSPTYIGGVNSSLRTRGGLRVDSGGVELPILSTSKKYTTGALDTNSLLFTNATDSLPVYMKAGVVKKLLSVFDSSVGYVAGAEVGHANGVAPLNGSGLVPSANLPAITISGQVFIDTSQVQMLAHAGATAGALSVRTDSNSVLLVLTNTPSSVRANWHITQGNGVSAFNSRTGAINPRSGDYGTDSVVEGTNNKYFTNARAQSVIAGDTGSSGFLVNTAKLADTAVVLRGLITGASSTLAQVLASGNTAANVISLGKKSGLNSYKQAKIGVVGPDSSGVVSIYDSSATNNITLTSGPFVASIGSITGPSGFALSSQSGSAVLTLAVGAGTGTLTNAGLSFAGGGAIPNFINNTSGVGANQLHGVGSAPSIVPGAGAGGGAATVAVSGTDLAGYITVGTAGSTTTGTVATITFSLPYGSAPRCVILTPANIKVAGLISTTAAYVDQANITTTTFTITSNTGALSASTTYKWYYTVIQ